MYPCIVTYISFYGSSNIWFYKKSTTVHHVKIYKKILNLTNVIVVVFFFYFQNVFFLLVIGLISDE